MLLHFMILFSELHLKGKSKRAEEPTRYVYNRSTLGVVLTRCLAAGLGAGMMEAIFAVTPSETIKCVILMLCEHLDRCQFRTKLIDDAKRPNPRYKGLVHGTACIVREEGLSGIYRGLFPVVSNYCRESDSLTSS
jgi:hypothetical protein